MAARWDIVIEPYWIEKKRNELADALSRFEEDKLTVLSFNRQDPSNSMSRQLPTYSPHPV